MAIAIDVTPKIDTTKFSDSIRLSLARSLLETAMDLLPDDSDAYQKSWWAIDDIDKRLRDLNNGV